jgi:hypothetical protein
MSLSIRDINCLVAGYIAANLHAINNDNSVCFFYLIPQDKETYNGTVSGSEVPIAYNIPKRITASEGGAETDVFAIHEQLYYMPTKYDWDIPQYLAASGRTTDVFGAVLCGIKLPSFDTSGGGAGILQAIHIELDDLYKPSNTVAPPNNNLPFLISLAVCADGSGDVSVLVNNLYNDSFWVADAPGGSAKNGMHIYTFFGRRSNTGFSASFVVGIPVKISTIYIRYHTSTPYPPTGSVVPPINEYIQKYRIKQVRIEVTPAPKAVNFEVVDPTTPPTPQGGQGN